MTELTEQFPNNQRCIEKCPRFAICGKLIAKGEQSLEEAKTAESYSSSGPEYETDDGERIPFDEFLYGPSPQQRLQEAGEALISSGTNMQRLLLEACTKGEPFVLTHPSPNGPTEDGSIEWVDGAAICQSDLRNMVFFTEEDLRD